MFGKCNCGKEGKWMFIDGAKNVMSCNKNLLCPSYKDLEDKLKFKNKEITHLNDEKRELEKTIEELKKVIRICS